MPITLQQLPAVLQAGDPEQTDKQLEASWTQLLGSSPEDITEADYSGSHGAEFTLIRFRAPENTHADLVALLDAANHSADPSVVTVELARLKIGTAGRAMRGFDLDAWLTVVGDELERYPTDVVRCACRRLIRREAWTPTVAELVEECEVLARRRRLLREALQRHGREIKPRPEDNHPGYVGRAPSPPVGK